MDLGLLSDGNYSGLSNITADVGGGFLEIGYLGYQTRQCQLVKQRLRRYRVRVREV